MKQTRQAHAVLLLSADLSGKAVDGSGLESLKHVARVLGTLVRDVDYLGRYGDADFLMMLAATGFSNGALKAEEVRIAVESAASPTGGKVTVSIGLAVAEPGQFDDGMALRRAEACLQDAKAAGGNRVVAVGYGRG